jgi:hypothetical protein
MKCPKCGLDDAFSDKRCLCDIPESLAIADSMPEKESKKLINRGFWRIIVGGLLWLFLSAVYLWLSVIKYDGPFKDSVAALIFIIYIGLFLPGVGFFLKAYGKSAWWALFGLGTFYPFAWVQAEIEIKGAPIFVWIFTFVHLFIFWLPVFVVLAKSTNKIMKVCVAFVICFVFVIMSSALLFVKTNKIRTDAWVKDFATEMLKLSCLIDDEGNMDIEKLKQINNPRLNGILNVIKKNAEINATCKEKMDNAILECSTMIACEEVCDEESIEDFKLKLKNAEEFLLDYEKNITSILDRFKDEFVANMPDELSAEFKDEWKTAIDRSRAKKSALINRRFKIYKAFLKLMNEIAVFLEGTLDEYAECDLSGENESAYDDYMKKFDAIQEADGKIFSEMLADMKNSQKKLGDGIKRIKIKK